MLENLSFIFLYKFLSHNFFLCIEIFTVLNVFVKYRKRVVFVVFVLTFMEANATKSVPNYVNNFFFKIKSA